MHKYPSFAAPKRRRPVKPPSILGAYQPPERLLDVFDDAQSAGVTFIDAALRGEDYEGAQMNVLRKVIQLIGRAQNAAISIDAAGLASWEELRVANSFPADAAARVIYIVAQASRALQALQKEVGIDVTRLRPKTGAIRRAPAISIVRTAKPDQKASAKNPRRRDMAPKIVRQPPP